MIRRTLATALIAGVFALVLLLARHQDSETPESASIERQPTSGSTAPELASVERTSPSNPSVEPPVTSELRPQPSPAASPPSDEGDRKFRLYSTVRSKTGDPVEGARVWYETPRGGWITSNTASDGSFILGRPYQPLPLELFAARNMYLPRTSVQWMQSGLDRPIVIEAGSDLRIRIVSEKQVKGNPELIPTASANSIPGPQISVRRVGLSEFIAEGVLPEVAYDVWIEPSNDGEYVLQKGARFKDGTLELHPLKASAFARGKVIAPAGVHAIQCSISIRSGLAVLSVTAEKDGSFVIGPMPAGEWGAEAHASDKTEQHWYWYGRLSTETPGSIVLHR